MFVVPTADIQNLLRIFLIPTSFILPLLTMFLIFEYIYIGIHTHTCLCVSMHFLFKIPFSGAVHLLDGGSCTGDMRCVQPSVVMVSTSTDLAEAGESLRKQVCTEHGHKASLFLIHSRTAIQTLVLCHRV